MKAQEVKGMSINPSASAKDFPDTPVEWYDFGGGNLVAPGIPNTDNSAGYMAALTCIKNGLYYFKVLEFAGEATEEELASMFKEYAPVFSAEVEKMTQETQQ